MQPVPYLLGDGDVTNSPSPLPGDSDSSEKDLPDSDLFCAACNKFFKTSNA